MSTLPNKSKFSYITIYALTKDKNGNFTIMPDAMKENLKRYLSRYRMMTDTIVIQDPKIVNFYILFEVTSFPEYNKESVLNDCVQILMDYFSNDNMEINKAIDLGEVKYKLYSIDGVMAVNNIVLGSRTAEAGDYNNYSYDFIGNKIGDIIPPTKQKSIFEIKYPESDIIGIVH